MKKIIMTASLAALGAVGLQAAYAPGLSATERTKPWSVAATLRGFYDDNYTTSPEKRSNPALGTARSSYGMEISPSASLNLPLDQTLISLSYQYSMRYYEDRESGSADHSHQFNARLNHAFTENYRLDLSDSFVIAQEPALMDPSQTTVPLRLNGNNMRNTAAAKFSADITRLFGVELGYSNSIYDYDNDQYAGLLNRMEHLITFDTRWHVLPKTVAILGYQYGMVNYDDSRTIDAATYGVAGTVNSKIRDNRSHYVYAGADQTINSKLNASVRLGGQFTEFQNAKSLSGGVLDDSSSIPYADASVTYAYTTGSYAQLGIKHSRLATDILALDQEATTVYGSINHQITAKLMGSLMGQLQNSSFNQGPFNNSEDNYFVVGLNLTYTINQYLAAEAGYNFDRLDSDIQDRSFTRNRVYLGLRASY